MSTVRPRQLFTRHPANPILTSEQWPYTVYAVFNPGATTGLDGQTVLLVRVEDRSGISHLTVARSSDGFTDWKIDPRPALAPRPSQPGEAWGIEDPRITKIGEEQSDAVKDLRRVAHMFPWLESTQSGCPATWAPG